MQLLRLKLLNFRQHADTDLEFGPGITGIIGPNGAGKTTLLEAVAWALYGMDAARGTRESIRWRRARPRSEVKVELEFSLGPHEYRVVRTLYGADLYLDGSSQPVVTTLGEVTSRLGRILKMSREEFFRTYFTGQKELAVMAALKPVERGRFLARLLGYDNLIVAQERVRGRRAELKAEVSALEAGFPDPAALAEERDRRAAAREQAAQRLAEAEEQRAATRAASDQHLPVFRGLTESRERYAAFSAERRVAEERVRQVVETVGRVAGEHAAAEAAREELANLLPALETYRGQRVALSEQEALAQDARERASLEAQLAELNAQHSDVEARLRESRESAARGRDVAIQLEADRQAHDAAERTYQERQGAWVRERQDAESKRQSLLDQYHDLATQRERIVAAGEAGACPTCGRALGTEFGSVLELLDTQLEEVKANGQYFRSRIEQLSRPPAELVELDFRRRSLDEAVERGAQALAVATRSAEEAISLEKQQRRHEEREMSVREALARLRPGYDAALHEALRRGVSELEPVAIRAQRLEAEAARAGRLVAELREAETRRAELVETLAGLERELASLAFTEEGYQSAAREMDRLEAAWREAELNVAVAQAELTATSNSLRDAERAQQAASARAARAQAAQRDFRLHNELDRAFTDLRALLIQEMRPELAALAADFLSSLTDGRFEALELDEEYNATVLQDGEPQQVISGGEEDLTNLVLRFGVSQMIADRAGQPLNLLVLDEIFGSLDEARREQVVHLLRALEARFPQVILITHIESVRESLDRVLRVRYDEEAGCARVSDEQVLPAGVGGTDADVAA